MDFDLTDFVQVRLSVYIPLQTLFSIIGNGQMTHKFLINYSYLLLKECPRRFPSQTSYQLYKLLCRCLSINLLLKLNANKLV